MLELADVGLQVKIGVVSPSPSATILAQAADSTIYRLTIHSRGFFGTGTDAARVRRSDVLYKHSCIG